MCETHHVHTDFLVHPIRHDTLHVMLWQNEHVSLGNGMNIQNDRTDIVFVHGTTVNLVFQYFAKHALGIIHGIVLLQQGIGGFRVLWGTAIIIGLFLFGKRLEISSLHNSCCGENGDFCGVQKSR
jgi:hypothetical protein